MWYKLLGQIWRLFALINIELYYICVTNSCVLTIKWLFERNMIQQVQPLEQVAKLTKPVTRMQRLDREILAQRYLDDPRSSQST